MKKFLLAVLMVLSINLSVFPSEPLLANEKNASSKELVQLSNWVSQLQQGLHETSNIETVYIGGGSARSILDHLYDGKALEMRDLDIFAISNQEVTADQVYNIGTHLETKEFGYFSRKDLRSRPRVPSNKPVLVRNNYVAGYGLHWLRDNGEILDLSVYHFKNDLDLNGIFDVDTTMIPLKHDFSVLDFAHKAKQLKYEDLKNEGYLYDRYDGYLHWRAGDINIINWLDIEADPLLKVMRVTRTLFKNQRYSFTKEEENNFRHLIESAKAQNQLQMTRGLLKVLSDDKAKEELSLLQQVGFFQQWLSEFSDFSFTDIDFSLAPKLDYGRDDREALGKLYYLIKQLPSQNERLSAIYTTMQPFDPSTSLAWIHEELTGELLHLEDTKHISEKRLEKIALSTALSETEKKDLLLSEIEGKWKVRKGIISGVFNPVHKGHLEMFKEAINEMVLDELIIIPHEGEPFYESPAPTQNRWEMLKILENEIEELKVISKDHLPINASDVESLNASLITAEPTTVWSQIIGSDSFERYVNEGHLANEKTDNILVIQRDQEKLFPIDQKYSTKIYYKSHPSSKIDNQKLHQAKNARKLASQGKNPSMYVPEKVAEYIISKGLYKESRALYCVTTNQAKFEKVQKIIPDAQQISINLPLTDWKEPRAAVKHKLKEAMKLGKFPVVVIEQFIQIDAISSDFVPLSDQTLSMLGNENVANMIKAKGQNSASILTLIGYASEEESTKIIEHIAKGEISSDHLEKNQSLKEAFVSKESDARDGIETIFKDLMIKRVGFITGVFNPIHFGHIQALSAAQKQFPMDRIIIIPTPATNHNEVPIDWNYRHEMIKVIAQQFEDIQPIPEYYKKWLDKGTGVAIDELKNHYPNAEFFQIMGSDSFARFEEQGRLDTLDERHQIIVIQRKGHECNSNSPKVSIIDLEQSEKSDERASSIIRSKLKAEESISHLVPEKVEKFIHENHLYQVDEPISMNCS